jgi:exopolyphosphatase / guanosine-5'-triphosphate,3'-diphosphate pyrophosphatase
LKLRAGIDVGTNTILLLVARWDGKELVPLEDHVTVVRLGEGLAKSGEFSRAAMARADDAFAKYAKILQRYPGIEIRAAATAGARDARNGAEYLRSVEQRFGLAVKLISGDEEAQFSFKGAVGDSRDPKGLAVVDIGGGSSEVVGWDGGKLLRYSFPIGCVKAHERFLLSDPPLASELRRLRDHADELFSSQKPLLKALGTRAWVGVAGTVTYLVAAQMALKSFEPEKVHGSSITYAKLQSLMSRLACLRGVERLGLGGMDGGRADVILAGAVVLESLMRVSGVDTIEASVRGLRYGLALQDQWP